MHDEHNTNLMPKNKHTESPGGDRTNNYHAVNNGFWDRPAKDRAARMDAACERGGVSNFFDLPPEDRAAAYDRD